VGSEKPDKNLYNFNGCLSITDKFNKTESFTLGLSNFIPRGGMVANC